LQMILPHGPVHYRAIHVHPIPEKTGSKPRFVQPNARLRA